MDINSLEIKTKANYNWDDIVYINDFDADSLEIIKRESKIGFSIYYIEFSNIRPFYFVINRLIGYIEEIKGSSENTTIEFRSPVMNVSCIIEKDNEYYPEIFLDECLYVKDNTWYVKPLFSGDINIFPMKKNLFSLKI